MCEDKTFLVLILLRSTVCYELFIAKKIIKQLKLVLASVGFLLTLTLYYYPQKNLRNESNDTFTNSV